MPIHLPGSRKTAGPSLAIPASSRSDGGHRRGRRPRQAPRSTRCLVDGIGNEFEDEPSGRYPASCSARSAPRRGGREVALPLCPRGRGGSSRTARHTSATRSPERTTSRPPRFAQRGVEVGQAGGGKGHAVGRGESGRIHGAVTDEGAERPRRRSPPPHGTAEVVQAQVGGEKNHQDTHSCQLRSGGRRRPVWTALSSGGVGGPEAGRPFVAGSAPSEAARWTRAAARTMLRAIPPKTAA
jgi:hypothetical protein